MDFAAEGADNAEEKRLPLFAIFSAAPAFSAVKKAWNATNVSRTG
jgi:hypothetical protein